MAEFDDLRAGLRRTRDHLAGIDDEIFATREYLKRLAARETELARVVSPNDERSIVERERLKQERTRAQLTLDRLNGARAELQKTEAGILGRFVAFTDPREGISRFDDNTPILAMPVRLETRFKEVAAERVPGAPPVSAQQLWVRVYPDDCWIDSFDPTLTGTEVANARTYWINIWQAGGNEDQERAAWRALVGSHGSGRGSWIIEQYQPTNLAGRPAKPRAQDLILTIAAEAANALTDKEADAAAAFWRAAWLADGDAASIDQARQTLVKAVGDARANEIVANYQPVNFGARPAGGFTRSQINVSVAFVLLPPLPDTKQTAWARAPRMTILPDRFVFIGYHGGDPPLVVAGNPVPSTLYVAPDPSAPEDKQLRHDEAGNLMVPDELRWLSDFDRAVSDGMGFRIPLTPAQARAGFDRVLVVGLRLNADAGEAKNELEALLRHHAAGRTGFSLVPQGTPTNNTEAKSSGFSRQDDADRSFDDRKRALFTPEADWLDKRDGQWLAEYLGIDPAVLAHVQGAGTTDQLAARAMNLALWPATLGYWMQTMMAPVFGADAIERTRDFFNRYVVATGAVPAIRLGSQPYGILPSTALSRMRWMNQHGGGEPGRLPDGELLPLVRRLYPLLLAIDSDWRERVPSISLSYVGRPGDPHAILLDIVGLHSGSVEWSERWAESLTTLFNRLKLEGMDGMIEAIITAFERQASRQLLTNLGYGGSDTPKLLDLVFSGAHQLLTGGVVDDTPLSETAPIRAYTTGGKNYLQWLIDAAGTSLDALYTQNGFVDDKPPVALLYLMLRHALQLGYHDVSVRLFENAGLYTATQAFAARSESPFIHVQENSLASESRYQPLYAIQPAITGSATQNVGAFIAAQISSLAFALYLRTQIAALERLKALPTAQLERAFADHVDCCSYRLDAWLQGLVTYQLAMMRNITPGRDAPVRQGIYLGAYGWLEDLRPEHKVLTPVELRDADLASEFAGEGEPPLVRDSTNQGYVHAPSLNHAVAAAVLRNGFISDASPQNRETMAVNLTSERVRTALALLEGIRGGQSLADLLGYQFERGLHDRHNLAEVDKYIYKLRKAFPLRADRMQSTKTEEGVSIESIEARNVIDGLAFVEQLKAIGNTTYPFGKTGLPANPTDAERQAIEAEAGRLLESHDAVADLALAEGVYQAVLGNYDRVASTYDAYARGNFPPEPDVIRTPFKGIGITSRVVLHLAAGADPAVSPIADLPMTPRAQAEPAINAWLATTLPALDQVGCVVTFRDAAAGAMTSQEVTLRQLDLQPADLVAIVRDDASQAMTELDDRVVRFAMTHFDVRPDVAVTIEYVRKQAAPFSVFEAMALLRSLRRLTTTSRPLKATDLALTNEAEGAQDAAPVVDKARFVLVRNALQTLRDDLAAFEAAVQAPLADLANRRGEILTDVDDYVADLAALLARAATFAIPQSGWGFAYDFERRVFAAILQQCADLVTRWGSRLQEFADVIAAHDGLPAAASDEERFRLLTKAERAISTVRTDPLPPTPAAFRTKLITVTRPAFEARRQQFVDIANTTVTGVAALGAAVLALLPVDAFDVTPFTLTSQEDEMIRFAEDAVRLVAAIIDNADRRLSTSKDRFDDFDSAASAPEKLAALERAAQALLGDDVRLVPEFALDPSRGAEMENALSASRSGSLFTHLTNPPDPAPPPVDFPVDTWVHGVARVRDKMHAWEQVLLLSAAFGRPEPALDALQLPVVPGDAWLGLEFPPGQPLDSERLLYTAHFAAPFDKTSRQCGLLLDEWSETIPGTTADTGITFHDDRPNTEAPQVMLLVTPSEFHGAWQWNDLIDALNETLEFAKRRAIEPQHIDALPYAPFLPATVMAGQARQLTIAANLALNNRIVLASQQT